VCSRGPEQAGRLKEFMNETERKEDRRGRKGAKITDEKKKEK
jgi:hypothetical protein